MEPLACSGTCAIAGHPIQLAFQDAIHSVTPSSQPADLYLAPGFIDLQVNGFAGVDYNAPRTPHAEIARSLRAQFATGVTRLYATVITGAPEAMQACLRNLAAARGSVRPISTSSTAGRTLPAAAYASSPSPRNGPKPRVTSSASPPKAWSPPSATRKPAPRRSPTPLPPAPRFPPTSATARTNSSAATPTTSGNNSPKTV